MVTQPVPMADLKFHRLDSLPATSLSWLRLRDHFVATVGPSAGSGRPFGPLLVLADATFSPRSRFPIHPHRDMEILSIVVRGELSHHGDQSNGETIKAREAQLISARDGMVHAEGNETDDETHMLQLWFTPDSRGGEAAHFLREIPVSPEGGRHLVAGDEGMPMRTSARVWWIDLVAGGEERLELRPGGAGYLLAVNAPLRLPGGASLAKGEGARVRGEAITVQAVEGPGIALWIEWTDPQRCT